MIQFRMIHFPICARLVGWRRSCGLRPTSIHTEYFPRSAEPPDPIVIFCSLKCFCQNRIGRWMPGIGILRLPHMPNSNKDPAVECQVHVIECPIVMVCVRPGLPGVERTQAGVPASPSNSLNQLSAIFYCLSIR